MQTDVTISLAQTVWLIGGITAIAAFVSWLMKPIKKLEYHETRIKTLEDEAEKREAREKFTINALNALVNHMIDGNNTDELRRVRDEYQREIINH